MSMLASPDTPTSFMYHSFPRRGKDEVEKGLRILESIAERGLLLTPELVNWPGEIKANGRRGHPVTAYQKRICFTNLRRDELQIHAETFGKFALEFDVSTLRELADRGAKADSACECGQFVTTTVRRER